jgi:ribosomal protein S18 acetylase RimI-like enzyme
MAMSGAASAIAAASHATIRYASEADWLLLKQLRLAALLDAPTAFGVTHASAAAYTEAQWRERAAGRGPARYLLALDGDTAIGMVAHVAASATDLNLIAMWVAPQWRGASVATRLVQAVQAHAIEQQLRRVVLDVSPDNLRAAAFYRRLGFSFLPEWEPLESHPHIQVQKMEWPTPSTHV